ncbi:hypothetical protein LWI29_030188 [Acer saccharum]|uniref:Uncharacterized protein n=1 Tax=Acer saccharum TaxID=4024 RepID=A0AA39RTL4_ACESA|nr:hypothetical protein LWI29_030188 [Acer saccharum]
MASSSKLLLFFLSPIFVHFLALGTIAELTEQKLECYKNAGNYSPNSSYEENLHRLLNSLSTKTVDYGFYNFSDGEITDEVYVIGICRPDMDPESCRKCISAASTNLTSSCPNFLLATRWLDDGEYNDCMLRYEKSKFYKPSIERTPPPNPKGKKNIVIIVVCSVVGSVILIIFIGCIILRMRKTEEDDENMGDIQNRESLQFNFSTIRDATDNFSNANKLGQGGFGAVFKGVLSDGQQIAVKRLAMNSKQGDLEFQNEVLFVAKLQHRNLVRLLGFCLEPKERILGFKIRKERKERILVYEFLPNSSLDHFISDPIKREILQWEKRYKIIEGIARGLLYLHEDSRLKIIHRDLKTSNVLLDSELNPKISDFGMARLFQTDQIQSITSGLAGTFGYMAPEYVKEGRISMKSDVYSFGTLVLEIMCGQKISSFGTEEETEGLLSYAWKNWNEGTTSNVIDPTLRDGSTDEMKKCIHIGLLCVQESVSDRPTMSSVVAKLISENVTLPPPSKPGFFMQNSVVVEASSSQEYYSGSTRSDQLKNEVVPLSRNDVSMITELLPR